ncbi:alpha/beta fold hydrolase [Streptacidiphilus sp. P02-A3a]|uniref:alpha/beta fold hydrolase n=1 Tax=Streptacidiphilus sp. P02-A3a TaxID=2704468 RepID=UPI0015F7D899|nr:alpha/beta hydrolase [Streptacidiphilus sp. P02-A3a]QMU67160.1 alpha/beta fold hydrolase [Streptacidiphilus sp. P02-A3a]
MTAELSTREAGDPGRPTLLLVHGSGQGARMWRRQLASLSDRYHVVAVDLPGFGCSPGPFSMARAVAGVARLAERHRPAHVCGISLGSVVAAGVAAERPELVDRLVLSGPVIAPARSGPGLIRRYRRWPGWLVRAVTDVPDRAGWLAVVGAMEATDLTDLLPSITAPTLVLCGQRDRECLPDAHTMAAAVPAAHLVVVPHVGHLIPVTAPKAFDAVVGGFLGSAG